MHRLFPLYASVLLSALAYGVTFPALSLQLERLGVSSELIGLNAAMPALGWLLVSPLLPRLQAALGVKILVISFLIVAAVGFIGASTANDYTTATVSRLVFGGAMGMHYRVIEYLLNAQSTDEVRGRNFGVYSSLFLIGIALGAAVQPLLGLQGVVINVFVCGSLALSTLPLLRLSAPAEEHVRTPTSASWFHISLAPLAFLAALIYGLFEAIPAYFLPIYAVRNGLGEDIAAYTVSAATLGALLGPIPLGIISDRYHNRVIPLFACASASAVVSLVVPYTQANTAAFLSAIALLGFSASCVYGLSLAILGDRVRGPALVEANASLGFVYAIGSLLGPIIHGLALGTGNTHGLMISSFSLFFALALGTAVLNFRRSERRAP